MGKANAKAGLQMNGTMHVRLGIVILALFFGLSSTSLLGQKRPKHQNELDKKSSADTVKSEKARETAEKKFEKEPFYNTLILKVPALKGVKKFGSEEEVDHKKLLKAAQNMKAYRTKEEQFCSAADNKKLEASQKFAALEDGFIEQLVVLMEALKFISDSNIVIPTNLDVVTKQVAMIKSFTIFTEKVMAAMNGKLSEGDLKQKEINDEHAKMVRWISAEMGVPISDEDRESFTPTEDQKKVLDLLEGDTQIACLMRESTTIAPSKSEKPAEATKPVAEEKKEEKEKEEEKKEEKKEDLPISSSAAAVDVPSEGLGSPAEGAKEGPDESTNDSEGDLASKDIAAVIATLKNLMNGVQSVLPPEVQRDEALEQQLAELRSIKQDIENLLAQKRLAELDAAQVRNDALANLTPPIKLNDNDKAIVQRPQPAIPNIASIIPPQNFAQAEPYEPFYPEEEPFGGQQGPGFIPVGIGGGPGGNPNEQPFLLGPTTTAGNTPLPQPINDMLLGLLRGGPNNNRYQQDYNSVIQNLAAQQQFGGGGRPNIFQNRLQNPGAYGYNVNAGGRPPFAGPRQPVAPFTGLAGTSTTGAASRIGHPGRTSTIPAALRGGQAGGV